MKNIIFYIIIITLLSISSNAVLVNRPLNISIANCYSINITAELEEGKSSPIEFVGCKKISENKFNCKCLNVDNKNFSIIMRTDNTLIRDIRQFDIDINAYYFETYRKTLSLNVEDGGDYYEVSNSEWKEKDNKIKYVTKIEYVDNIVYKDKIVEVPKEVIVYKDRIVNNTIIEYINKTEYIENTTKIDELEKNNEELKSIIKFLEISLIILMIAGIILPIYIKNKNDNRKNN